MCIRSTAQKVLSLYEARELDRGRGERRKDTSRRDATSHGGFCVFCNLIFFFAFVDNVVLMILFRFFLPNFVTLKLKVL